jgi:hypothetical protein
MPVVLARSAFPPGRLQFDRQSGRLWVRCVDTWAEVTGVSLPTRKHMGVADFVNGFLAGRPSTAPPPIFVCTPDE